MGKVAFLLGLAVVLMVGFFSGAETAGKVGAVAFLAVCTFFALLTEKPRMRTKFPSTKRTTPG